MQGHNTGQSSNNKPNKLKKETSPYLLQHAYNPVQWYPWGEEALQKARHENKPIFLSIGYSACHWCHVMAHESFEDDETAKIMNENFINIKVDREERPDIDDIYQRACQLASGTGGWPLSVFLTPDQKPFYVGTYFPKEGMNHHNMPGFKTILLQLSAAYRNKNQEIKSASDEFISALSETAKGVVMRTADGKDFTLERSILDEAAIGLLQMGDAVNGGFGNAPKFPSASSLLFLLRYYEISGLTRFLDFVLFTSNKMAAGGIYDHLGGGFARYSTDQKWLTPHFEKMLYDNALLVQLYAELYQITKDERHMDVANKILDYVMREMTAPEGGFYSSQDADSENEEGRFYIWDKREIVSLLGDPTTSDIFCEFYGVTDGGNFEGKNILNLSVPASTLSKRYGKTLKEITEIIETAAGKLFAARENRVKPGRDEKILTSWNGLMISGFAKGYGITGDMRYLEVAENAVRFIESKLISNEGRMRRTYKDGESKYNGYIEDYAFYVAGLLDLFGVDSRSEYLDNAIKYTDFMLQHFWDENEGNFFFTSDDHEQLITRTKIHYDLAIPSGNSIAATNLIRLYHYAHNDSYFAKALRIIGGGARPAAENPFGFGQLLNAIYLYLRKPIEVTVIIPPIDIKKKSSSLSAWLNRHFLPNGINAVVNSNELHTLLKYSYFEGRSTVSGVETAFVCKDSTCSLPIKSKEGLENQLKLS
ncbi:MAG TPA: thioredoxin domain-containing protein [Nitrososphaera sp.]|jgi:uncharacterized protein YyaL (SSP411 family)